MHSNRKNLSILFFTMVVVMLGFGMVIPILPFYIKSFGASGRALGALMAVYGLMQFIFAPLWGEVSDRRGRKPILMVGLFGNALAMLLMGLSTQLWMLFAGRVLAGVLSSATLPTAMAYIGDTTSKEQRGGGMGLIGATVTWYVQVAVVVTGHVAGLSLAHDRALVLYADARTATRSQYWLLAVMIGFTSLALWLLSQANV